MYIRDRYIITYSDKITEAIVDDLLEQFALEMNDIEEKQKCDILSTEQQHIALKLLEHVEQLEEEQTRVKCAWLETSEEKARHNINLKLEEEVREKKEERTYFNPFEMNLRREDVVRQETIEEESEKVITIYKPQKKMVLLPLERVKKIEWSRKTFEKYRLEIEGSLAPEKWITYDHITNDLLSELLDELADELSDTLEQNIDNLIQEEFEKH
eukprot:TRINITY_DN17430_c0_g1_i1.p1 TRINITY_DN17430_c0_g1~~TRINITY_DN17430_c0_g1_i1.p1  ORF type:complete len:224 (+),score=51.81 TRINITY_DN17430_c0_g1_i1:34-672(+)